MENSSPLILEISSDEEAGFGDSRKGSGFGVGGGQFGDGEDCNWLSKLLDEVGGGNNRGDDSDDVVVVSGEVFPKTPKKSRSESLKPSAEAVLLVDGGDDDDCVVLDGDPDTAVVVVNSKVVDDDDDDDGDSDDLKIVGEKGEVACRDFPHPRHLCAKFLFASTPHEVHCGQCHCYVCDSLAPCLHWGTGISHIDHCHASDKEKYWKAERERVKKGDKPVPVNSTTNSTPRLEAYFPRTQVPALARPQPNPNSVVFNPLGIHPSAMSSSVNVPNAVDRVRIHPSGYAFPRSRSPSQLVSPHLQPTSNNNIASRIASRDKSHHVGGRSQPYPSRTVFKQHGSVGASPNNRHAYRSQLSRDASLKRCHALQTPFTYGLHSSSQRNVGNHTVDSVMPQPKPNSSPHSMNVRRANYSPSQPRMHSRPHSGYLGRESNVNRDFPTPLPLQPNISAQPSVDYIENLVLPQPYVSQANNPAPSQTLASYESDSGNAFGNQLHSRSMVSSHPNGGNNLENHSPQPQAHNNPISLFINGQNDVQQGNHTQNGIDVNATDCSFFSDSSLSSVNQQIHAESRYQSTSPAETSPLQNVLQNGHHPSIAPLDNFPRQNGVLADYTSPINDADRQFPENRGPDSSDFQFDSWMFENQSLSGAVEVPLSPSWNVFSPEPAFVDSGTLFQF